MLPCYLASDHEPAEIKTKKLEPECSYFYYWPDKNTRLEETMGTIAALKLGLGFAGVTLGVVVAAFCVYFAVLARKAKPTQIANDHAK